MSQSKPITLLRQEYMDNLLELSNNSGLPMFCIEDVLKNFIQQVHIASVQQYESDKEQYEKNNKKSNAKE